MCNVNRRRTRGRLQNMIKDLMNNIINLGLEQHDRPDEDVNTVKVFKDFHTNTKKGLSDAARVVLVIVNAHRKFLKCMDIVIAFTQEYSRVSYLSIGKQWLKKLIIHHHASTNLIYQLD
jgi:predicted unusual protein kinase regulating ubiquinone biosynthesis (AarF/ABC1/UbiB family)